MRQRTFDTVLEIDLLGRTELLEVEALLLEALVCT